MTKVEITVLKGEHVYDVRFVIDGEICGIIMRVSEDLWDRSEIRFMLESTLQEYLKSTGKEFGIRIKPESQN